jgi:20S proteasome subunit alpha 5
MEENIDHNNVQVAQVTKEKGFEILDEARLKEIIDAMPAPAPIA